jgi:transcriptional regulator with XRE-family HTH domain
VVRHDYPDWSKVSWQGRPLRQILADRDIGVLFQFLSGHGYSRAAIAAHTGISENRVSAISKGRQQVSAYAVLARICEGLSIPREMMGLGGNGAAVEPVPSLMPVAICGSRGPECDEQVLDSAVVALASLFRDGTREIRHGPRGIGIEVVTYIGNHFRPLHLRQAVGIFGHANVIRDVAAVIVAGGGKGTHDEVDLAIASGAKLIPLAETGGAAKRAHLLMRGDEPSYLDLASCRSSEAIAAAVAGALR